VRGLINPDPSTSTCWYNFSLDGKKDEYECGARSIKDDLKYLIELFPDVSKCDYTSASLWRASWVLYFQFFQVQTGRCWRRNRI